MPDKKSISIQIRNIKINWLCPECKWPNDDRIKVNEKNTLVCINCSEKITIKLDFSALGTEKTPYDDGSGHDFHFSVTDGFI